MNRVHVIARGFGFFVVAMGIWSFLVGCLGADGAPDNVVVPEYTMQGSAVAYTHDGLCAIADGGDWKFVRLSDGKVGGTLPEAGGAPTDARFSANEHFLAAVGGDTVRVWRLSDGHKLAQIKAQSKYPIRLIAVALSPDGQWVAASDLVNIDLYVWRVADGKLVAKRDEGAHMVLGWTRDGILMAGRGFRVQNDRLVEVPPDQSPWKALSPMDVWPSRDGEKLALQSAEGLALYDLRSGSHHELKLPNKSITNVCWSPNKERLALRYQTGNSVSGPHIRSFVEVRRTRDGALLHSMQVGTSHNGTDTYGTDMSISGDGKWLIIESRDRKLGLWDMSGWTATIPEPSSADQK
ncbi:hypothetical protein IAD21_05034 [Abditibacteriota bacterium]|nr:hypothetical protein IAD21_05034 [Abditibacteriota bacterium]